MDIDNEFDFWAVINPGRSTWDHRGSRDPDGTSKALQRAHQILRSKCLPSGPQFDLRRGSGTALHWGEFRLSSDCISNSYVANSRMRHITLEAGQEAEELFRWGAKIGAYILFPAQRIEGKPTINGARGMNIKIGDRMELTLEAIRRNYVGEDSPLAGTLARYADFFALFSDFRGYVDFWMLNDLVDEEYCVTFWLPLDNFARNATPANLAEYVHLKSAALKFLRATTERIRLVLNNSVNTTPLRGVA